MKSMYIIGSNLCSYQQSVIIYNGSSEFKILVVSDL